MSPKLIIGGVIIFSLVLLLYSKATDKHKDFPKIEDFLSKLNTYFTTDNQSESNLDNSSNIGGQIEVSAFKEDNSTDQEDGLLYSLGQEIINKTQQTIKSTFGLDSNKSFVSGTIDKVKIVFPGTKWCGTGTLASSFEELGKFSRTDSCCREHDQCPISISPGEEKFGLLNEGFYVRSHCDCDAALHTCLKKIHGIVANSVGYTYFTVLNPQCLKKDYIITRCLEKNGDKCVKYEKDEKKPKVYQWFDNPLF